MICVKRLYHWSDYGDLKLPDRDVVRKSHDQLLHGSAAPHISELVTHFLNLFKTEMVASTPYYYIWHLKQLSDCKI